MRANTPNQETLVKVKVLKKVRRRFIHKTPDEEENQALIPDEEENQALVPAEVDPAAHLLANRSGFVIKASVGLIEIGRKLHLGPEHLNFTFNIESAVLENLFQANSVRLNLIPIGNRPLIPWEYTIKRLESYGDLDLAIWAQRIKEHYINYNKIIADIEKIIKSDKPEIQTMLNKIRSRAALARQEIESKCAFNRYIQFFKKDTVQPLSCCYSDKFLKQLGYTSESFINWAKENGIPKVLSDESDVYGGMLKGLLTNFPMLTDTIQESPAMESIIYIEDGSKTKMKVRFINIFEPTPEGMFYYTYIVLCDENTDKLQISKRKLILAENESDDAFKNENDKIES